MDSRKQHRYQLLSDNFPLNHLKQYVGLFYFDDCYTRLGRFTVSLRRPNSQRSLRQDLVLRGLG